MRGHRAGAQDFLRGRDGLCRCQNSGDTKNSLPWEKEILLSRDQYCHVFCVIKIAKMFFFKASISEELTTRCSPICLLKLLKEEKIKSETTQDSSHF